MMELSWHCPFIGQLVLILQLQGGTVLAGSVFWPGYNSCHIGHATIAQFDIVFIAYHVQAVMRREVLLEQVKEDLFDVSLYMLKKCSV